ncbi:hypothetical protein PILCRDRAFT_16093 [Piloderma croceum F 1598]|uniref:Uncharacterized protein n=1 Tax=Piloderma croceum (strain F 1598) TaxID=765440 RepID=A0A0C3EXJ1_PILCF|nr:hypothetical protein PILCRDRAFT_16093 [Piloderma croceum F 1598]
MPPINRSSDEMLTELQMSITNAAKGHTNVARTLFLRDTHAYLIDTHGVTHEILARENWMEGMAEMLKEWLANKNRDSREREGDVGSGDEPQRKDDFRRGPRLHGGHRSETTALETVD